MSWCAGGGALRPSLPFAAAVDGAAVGVAADDVEVVARTSALRGGVEVVRDGAYGGGARDRAGGRQRSNCALTRHIARFFTLIATHQGVPIVKNSNTAGVCERRSGKKVGCDDQSQ